MRNKILIGLCLLAVLMGSFWVLAEETGNDTTSTSVTTTSTAETSTDTTTDTSDTTTSTSTPTTGKLKTSLSASLVNGSIVVKLEDANGIPVYDALITLTVDGNIYRGNTDLNGTWVFGANLSPAYITCVFEGNEEYEGASYTWGTPTSATPTQSTTRPTQVTTTVQTSQNTSVSFLSTEPGTETSTDGIITQPTGGTTAVFPIQTQTQPGQVSKNSSFLSMLFIGLAVLLFIGAGLMIYLFIIRKPADEWEDEELAEAEEDLEQGQSLASADEDLAISLDQLFEDKNQKTSLDHNDDDIRL